MTEAIEVTKRRKTKDGGWRTEEEVWRTEKGDLESEDGGLKSEDKGQNKGQKILGFRIDGK